MILKIISSISILLGCYVGFTKFGFLGSEDDYFFGLFFLIGIPIINYALYKVFEDVKEKAIGYKEGLSKYIFYFIFFYGVSLFNSLGLKQVLNLII